MRSARCRPTVYVTDGPRSAAPAIDTRACCVSAFVRDEEPWKIVVPNSHTGYSCPAHAQGGGGQLQFWTKLKFLEKWTLESHPAAHKAAVCSDGTQRDRVSAVNHLLHMP